MSNICQCCGSNENVTLLTITCNDSIELKCYTCAKCKNTIVKNMHNVINSAMNPKKYLDNLKKITIKDTVDFSKIQNHYIMTYEEQRDKFLHKFVLYNKESFDSDIKIPVIFYVVDIIKGTEDEVWKKVCFMFNGIVVHFKEQPHTFSILYPILNMEVWHHPWFKSKYNFTTSCEILNRNILSNDILSKKQVIEMLECFDKIKFKNTISELKKEDWEQKIIEDVLNLEHKV